jgi:hypothetical protein
MRFYNLGKTTMTTARTAMHYIVMAAFVCVTSQSALAQSKVTPAKATPVVAVKPAPASSKKPPVVKQTCLDIYNKATVTAVILDNKAKVTKVSATPAPTLSTQDLKNSNIQTALRAKLLKVALVALTKLPPGKACDAIIAKIDEKFSRS